MPILKKLIVSKPGKKVGGPGGLPVDDQVYSQPNSLLFSKDFKNKILTILWSRMPTIIDDVKYDRAIFQQQYILEYFSTIKIVENNAQCIQTLLSLCGD